MPIFKKTDLCYEIIFGIIDNLNKEPVNSITVDFNVFGYVVVQEHTHVATNSFNSIKNPLDL